MGANDYNSVMTDSTLETSSSAASGAKANGQAEKKAASSGRGPGRGSSLLGIAFVLVLILAVALGAAAWYLYQHQQAQQEQMNAELTSSVLEVRKAASQVQALRAQSDMDQARLQHMESQLEASREQLDGLEQALQMLTANGGELALLNDIDQLLEIAQQQLTLGGNVANAIIGLETAQARLARAALPALAPLQQAVNGDLERLRAVPTTDTTRLQSRLSELSQLVASAPLLVRDLGVVQTPTEQAQRQNFVPAQAAPDAGWWEKTWVSTQNALGQGWQLVSHDLRQLVSVRRIDDSNALLISAEQAGQLRDNLRLRLMTARLALMMRQNDIWHSELQAVQGLVEARFDLQTVDGKRALALATQLTDADVAVALPESLNSRQAVQALRLARASEAQPDSSNGGSPAQPQAPASPVPSETEPSTAPVEPSTADQAPAASESTNAQQVAS